MKRAVGLGVAMLLSAALASAATAAPAPAAGKPEVQRGLKNVKKAQQGQRARYEKIRAKKKAAQAARQQAMDRKASVIQ